MYEGYVSRPVFVRFLIMPHVKHMCVLLPFKMLNIRHTHLGLHTWVSLKGRAICIWSFGYNFAYAIKMGCAGFKLSFCIISILQLLTIIK